MRWPKIEKDGALVDMTAMALCMALYIFIPLTIFNTYSLGNCLLGSALLSLFVSGIREQGESKPRAKLEITQFFLIGYICFCLIIIATIAFANISHEDKIGLAQCSVLFGGYLTIIYIVEKTIIERKEKREQEENWRHIIKNNAPKIGETYTSSEILHLNDWNKTTTLSTKHIWIIIDIDDKTVHLQDILDPFRTKTEFICDFPFKYKPIYNAISFDLLKHHERIKDEIEERIERIQERLMNKGKD